MSCILCDKKALVPQSIIYQDKEIVMIHRLNVDVPGYCLAYPVRHVTRFDALTATEINTLFRLTQRVVQILEDSGVPRVYLCSFGEVVPHFHLHILPRDVSVLNIPEVCEGGVVDGPKWCSYVQQHKKIDVEDALKNQAILDKIEVLRAGLLTEEKQ